MDTLIGLANKALNELSPETHIYQPFIRQAMVGNLIVGFATKQVYPNISNIQTGKVKTGMGGSAGNKGAVIGRFDIYDTSIVLANAHFESGQSKI